MREHSGSTHGWANLGPTRGPVQHCSSVRVVTGPREGATYAPYTDEEVAAIVKQGKENPRPLTLEESRLVSHNKMIYRGIAALQELEEADAASH